MARLTTQQAIGKFIKRERIKQKMTLKKFSLLALENDCYANKISQIERGLVKNYTIDTLDKLLKALGFRFADLFKE